MPDYLVRFAQVHETFRKVELQALADLAGVDLKVVRYDESVGVLIPITFSSLSRLYVTIFHGSRCTVYEYMLCRKPPNKNSLLIASYN